MLRLAALVVFAAGLAACGGPPAPVGPPEGWTGTSDRWWVPGADTSAAFRDLSSFEAMGVEPSADEFTRWVQDQMIPLYRSHPEIVDSVFTAGFLPDLPRPTNDAESATIANTVKRDFYQRYNNAQKMGSEGLARPDSLAGVTGEVVVQVYISRDSQPVAVQLVEGTGTALDQMAMRDAATAGYTEAWVRPRAGQSAGVKIPSWVRVTHRFAAQ